MRYEEVSDDVGRHRQDAVRRQPVEVAVDKRINLLTLVPANIPTAGHKFAQ
jgi:hypothetical protein